tara:strand:- start:31921 stop:32565 length:645 start_codon:yes stop_codon:yes gene_type:complete
MAIGLIGTKAGMTRVSKDNIFIPVTVVTIDDNSIVQIKTSKKEGYDAIQVTTGEKKAKKVTNPLKGHYLKGNVIPGKLLHEFNVSGKELESYKLGDKLDLNILSEGQKVDVQGTSKGKGFAGVIKRWNFRTQDASHGNSLSHRAPGSIGQNQSPGKVFKGKKMAGHLGNEKQTIQNLEVIQINKDKKYLLIKGAVPGCIGSIVVVKPTVKNKEV